MKPAGNVSRLAVQISTPKAGYEFDNAIRITTLIAFCIATKSFFESSESSKALTDLFSNRNLSTVCYQIRRYCASLKAGRKK
jgi:hypothetical protein